MRMIRSASLAAVAACALFAAGCSSRADRGVAAGVHDPGLHIGPATADVTSQLEAVVDVKGVDPASCGYAWTRNGQPIHGETSAVLAPSQFRKDDLVGVAVTLPSSAAGGARQLKAQVRIGNAPPNVAAARIAVSASTSGTVLTAEQESADPDGDAVTSDYRWYRNGSPVEGARGSGLQVASVSRGDRFVVEVVVSDGASRSEPRRSSEFVLENRPPAFTSQPASVVERDGFYRYQAAAQDPDGDAVRFELVQAPEGMTISPGGAIEWKFPTDPQRAKSFHVVLKVTDSKGGEATQTIDLAL